MSLQQIPSSTFIQPPSCANTESGALLPQAMSLPNSLVSKFSVQVVGTGSNTAIKSRAEGSNLSRKGREGHKVQTSRESFRDELRLGFLGHVQLPGRWVRGVAGIAAERPTQWLTPAKKTVIGLDQNAFTLHAATSPHEAEMKFRMQKTNCATILARL
jgi:hypothetical protein